MSFKIITTAYADKAIKKLSKRYHSFSNDIKAFREELLNNPIQGDEIAPHVRKIRMAITSKGRGKSGGARVITFNALVSEQDGKIYLLLIYDKADTPNVKMNVIKEIIEELGL